MNGFLGSADEYKIWRSTSSHVIYTNEDQILAIPFIDEEDGIWVMGDAGRIPGGPPQSWVKLCPN